MEPENPEYIPRPGMDKSEMKQMQRKIGREAVFEDDFEFNVEDSLTVVGVDQAFTEEKSVSCAVTVEDGEITEEVSAAEEIHLPYIPGLLAFREGGSIVKALKKLKTDPDLLMLDGSGRIHFRQAGIATHIGLIFEKPSVGAAKNLLCGQPVKETAAMREGEKVEIKADSRVEGSEGIIGYAFQSRQYDNSTKINPLYISPGHRVSNRTAVNLAQKFCDKYKLPVPIRTADKRVSYLTSEEDKS